MAVALSTARVLGILHLVVVWTDAGLRAVSQEFFERATGERTDGIEAARVAR